jgi:flagellar hook assembly protein FlgD
MNLVTIKIYDILGRKIATLVDERKQPGEYNVTWNAEGVPSGVYFYRIVAGNFVEKKKMILLR